MYTFSLENFKRPREQIDPVMRILKDLFIEYAQPGGLLEKCHCAIRVLGRLDLLDDDMREIIRKAMEASRHQKERFLNVYVAYTSRDEIARAVQATASGCCLRRALPSSITAMSLAAQMDAPNDPPVDILVRTSGVCRLSDFLLWQCHQDTSIQFVDPFWPDFGMCDLFFVILWWQRNVHLVNLQKPSIGFLVTLFIFVLVSITSCCCFLSIEWI